MLMARDKHGVGMMVLSITSPGCQGEADQEKSEALVRRRGLPDCNAGRHDLGIEADTEPDVRQDEQCQRGREERHAHDHEACGIVDARGQSVRLPGDHVSDEGEEELQHRP